MGRFEKHLGKGDEIEIEGEKYLLKPLDTESLPMFFKAMKAFSGAGEGASVEDMLKNIDEDGLVAVQFLIDKTLTKSFPEEPEEERKQFGLKYMVTLIGKIFEINMESGSVEVQRKQKVIDKIKQKQNVAAESKKKDTR